MQVASDFLAHNRPNFLVILRFSFSRVGMSENGALDTSWRNSYSCPSWHPTHACWWVHVTRLLLSLVSCFLLP